jgi:uncharacterized CHY-type Zn-finger protein
MERVCEVCGKPKQQRAYGMDLCNKHYAQYRRHGKFLEKTIYDKNDIVIDGDVVEIILRNNSAEEVARTKVSYSKMAIVKEHKWYLAPNGYVANAKNGVYLHRFLLNADNNELVDHEDGNPLNNLDSNIRKCTRSQNNMNRKAKGVYVDNRMSEGTKKWYAEITVDRKKKRLGHFYTEEDAIKARIKAEEEYFGEFRRKDKYS